MRIPGRTGSGEAAERDGFCARPIGARKSEREFFTAPSSHDERRLNPGGRKPGSEPLGRNLGRIGERPGSDRRAHTAKPGGFDCCGSCARLRRCLNIPAPQNERIGYPLKRYFEQPTRAPRTRRSPAPPAEPSFRGQSWCAPGDACAGAPGALVGLVPPAAALPGTTPSSL